jgi:hypothetical protein
MRFIRFGFLLLLGAGLATASVLAQAQRAKPGKEIAIVDFTDKTKVGDAVLFGKYVVVHDDAKMATGEPCLYIYSYKEGEAIDQVAGQPGRLVLSFHCRPVERSKAREVILTLGMSKDPSVFVLREIQLPGSVEGHQVPEAL